MKQNDNIATKSSVKEDLMKAEARLQAQIEKKLDTVTFLKYKDEILSRLDKILGLYQKLDDERTVMAYRQREHTDQLEDHEDRIKSLEIKFLQ